LGLPDDPRVIGNLVHRSVGRGAESILTAAASEWPKVDAFADMHRVENSKNAPLLFYHLHLVHTPGQ
jgi:hypothetical protein